MSLHFDPSGRWRLCCRQWGSHLLCLVLAATGSGDFLEGGRMCLPGGQLALSSKTYVMRGWLGRKTQPAGLDQQGRQKGREQPGSPRSLTKRRLFMLKLCNLAAENFLAWVQVWRKSCTRLWKTQEDAPLWGGACFCLSFSQDGWLLHVLGWGTYSLQGFCHTPGAFWNAAFNNEPMPVCVRTQAHSRACHKL